MTNQFPHWIGDLGLPVCLAHLGGLQVGSTLAWRWWVFGLILMGFIVLAVCVAFRKEGNG